MRQVILGGNFRERNVLGKELECVNVPFSAQCRDVTFDTPVVLHQRANVPTFLAVIGPGGTLIGLEVDYHFGAKGRQRCFVEVEIAMQVGIRQQFWVDL